jgi:hypothetical protein
MTTLDTSLLPEETLVVVRQGLQARAQALMTEDPASPELRKILEQLQAIHRPAQVSWTDSQLPKGLRPAPLRSPGRPTAQRAARVSLASKLKTVLEILRATLALDVPSEVSPADLASVHKVPYDWFKKGLPELEMEGWIDRETCGTRGIQRITLRSVKAELRSSAECRLTGTVMETARDAILAAVPLNDYAQMDLTALCRAHPTVSPSTFANVLNKLQHEGLIERAADGPGEYYYCRTS